MAGKMAEEMKVIPLITEYWRMDGGVAFGVVPKSIWGKHHEPDDMNLLPVVNRLLLVHTGSHLVLVDAGFGNKRDEKYYRYKYIYERLPLADAIRSAGFSPEEVTDVILTHLHDDHVGGVVSKDGDKLTLVCPNARHHISRKQLYWATHPNSRESASYFSDNIDPIIAAGKLNEVTEPSFILPGVEVILVDGHTGGQMVPLFYTHKGVVAFMADFIPTRTHIPVPYLASVDIQPLIALDEKRSYLERAFGENHILVFEHDAQTEACRLAEGEKGVVAGEPFVLSDVFA
jgi:glyoxylase-like metal-dependent hydrolase (beta-lactamase superfamily II)